ncbi:hypothetical protein ACIBO2_19650 [Nonomuraea sp. NPDC050022]|uniref:hypothetical protein n=1 Tax=Nonomuraea sp. NPDC050022 TaxID=3364358 RepID=UPI0037B360D1
MDPSGTPEQAMAQVADLDIGAAITRAATAAHTAAERERQALQQLAELHTAYPEWDINRRRDYTGEWWVAELLCTVTEQMALLGVIRVVRQRDGAALAMALSGQRALMQRSRA